MTEKTQTLSETVPEDRSDAPPANDAPLWRRPVPMLIALAVIAAIGALLFYLLSDEPAEEERSSPTMTVTATAPTTVAWPTTISASGPVAAWQEASIGTQIGSYRLIEVRVNVGDHVQKGQILARLDPALLKAEEAQLLASYEEAEANRKRALGLQGSGAISDQDVLQFVTQAKTAAALLAGKRLELRYTNVVAPDDGTISARTATLGAVVPAGQELFRLIRKDRLEWRGELTANQLAPIQKGQEIALELPDGSAATAIVRQTAPSLDEVTRLATVYADIRPGSRARAGMFASGSIELGHSPALVVPAEAVIIRDGRSHVLVLAGDGSTPRVSLREVATGRRRDTQVEIIRGLSGNERVVVQGAGFLNDRDIVRIASSGQKGGAARP